MIHRDFKLIVRGRDLTYPVLRLTGLFVLLWIWGFAAGASL